MEQIGTPLQWGVFFALVAVMLALDLGVFHRKERRISLREALFWSIFWTILAFGFNYWIYRQFGSEPGIEFLTGYVIERSLSFDNIFVFIVIFNYFAVAAQYQHRVLFWGILGALISRGLFIAMGAALIERFEWMIFIFGAFLVYTGVKILFEKGETEVHPEQNPVVKLFQRFVPLTPRYHGKRFFALENGRRVATPLMLVLVVIEATDIVFAVDSIPAIFAITRNQFIIFTSNIFAILGLRALYFLLAGMVDRFAYLSTGLAVILAFIGLKMLAIDIWHVPIWVSLGVIAAVLAASTVLSMRQGRHA